MKLYTRILFMIILVINFGSDSIKEKDNKSKKEELNSLLKKETISKGANIMRYICTSIVIVLHCVMFCFYFYGILSGCGGRLSSVVFTFIINLCAIAANILHISLKPSHKIFKISTFIKDSILLLFIIALACDFFIYIFDHDDFDDFDDVIIIASILTLFILPSLPDIWTYIELYRMNKRVKQNNAIDTIIKPLLLDINIKNGIIV